MAYLISESIPKHVADAVRLRGDSVDLTTALLRLLGAEERVCHHCGELFVFQEGRAETNLRRGRGVKFCSKRCARNAAQRAYRERRKDEA